MPNAKVRYLDDANKKKLEGGLREH
jgi:hypothetical protein